MKIDEVKVGETYATDPWTNGTNGVRRIEVTGIEVVEESVYSSWHERKKTRNVRKVRGICRDASQGGRAVVGQTVVINAKAIVRLGTEQDARNAALAASRKAMDAAVAALAAVGVEGHASRRANLVGTETVHVSLSLEEARALAERLVVADDVLAPVAVDAP